MKFRSLIRYISLIVGILLLAFAVLFDTVLEPWFARRHMQHTIEDAQRAMSKKTKAADKLLLEWSQSTPEELFDKQEEILQDSRRNKVWLYVYSGEGLLFWTGNEVFPQKFIEPGKFKLQSLDNGLYLQKNLDTGSLGIIALIPVQYRYPFENQYLKNILAFFPEADVKFEISPYLLEKSYPVESYEGEYIFSMTPTEPAHGFHWLGPMFILSIILIGWFVIKQIKILLRKGLNVQAIGAFLGFVALFVLIWKFLKLPLGFFDWPIFSPEFYASSHLFSSLGDLLLFTIMLSAAVWLSLQIKVGYTPPQTVRRWSIFIGIVLLVIFAVLIERLTQSIVIDSRISYDLTNLLSLNRYSFLGLIVLLAWVACFIAWARRLTTSAATIFSSHSQFIIFLLSAFVVAILLLVLLDMLLWKALVFAFASFITLYFCCFIKRQGQFTLIASHLLLATVFITSVLGVYQQQKVLLTQKRVADNIVTERDEVAEYLFNDIYQKLLDDPYIKSYFLNPVLAESFIEQRIRKLYFSGYFTKYDVIVRSFSPEGTPFKSPFQRPLQHFNDALDKNATPIQGNHFYFLNEFSGLPYYVGIVPISRRGRFLGTIMVEFMQKAFYEESVYPELLLSEQVTELSEHENFSYAVYNNNVLTTQNGSYSYPVVMPVKLQAGEKMYELFQAEGYDHLVHRVSGNLIVIVSSQERSLLYYFSGFSFMLLFAGFLWLLASLFPHAAKALSELLAFAPGRVPVELFFWRRLSFRYKILLTVIGGMTIALLLITAVTVNYIIFQHNKDEKEELRKKTLTVTGRFESELQEMEQEASISSQDLQAIVKELSDLYQTDINLFDVQGNLLATTQSLLYERDLIAPKMDPMAYMKFNSRFASRVEQEEEIGELNYLSSYMPVRNIVGRVTAYLNLPYFSQEQELNERISDFATALINIYLLLFLILVALGAFLGRTITAPLEIISRSLRRTNLMNTSELIVWQSTDEIGQLVREYNNMIVQLRDSAERLAESEREGAWKQMAQQVAHEIKNPLTPMKLNVQRLQHAFIEDAPNKEELLKKVTDLLIRQINSLSEIATAFSAYARMPKGEPEPVHINEVLKQVADLHSQERNAEVNVELSPEDPIVRADNDQMFRAFNNLVKNAIQSIPPERKGIVTIRSLIDNGEVRVEIQDNGSGIPEDLRDKIFVPRFSTKTSGMGLGLAIVRNIIDMSGGEIGFSTTPEEGSTFYVIMPLVNA